MLLPLYLRLRSVLGAGGSAARKWKNTPMRVSILSDKGLAEKRISGMIPAQRFDGQTDVVWTHPSAAYLVV